LKLSFLKGSSGAESLTSFEGHFGNLAELKRTFQSVDYVRARGRGFHVFNIGGNKYRLVAVVHFNAQKLFIRQVLTHAEYDRGDWKK
jgi:mRNA interferase HigB